LGEPIDADAVDAAIGAVYGLELFENVDYQVTQRDEQTGLTVTAMPKSWGPNYLQLGMAYSSAGGPDSRFAFAGSYLATAINRWGAEWRSTLAIGDEPAFATDYYQPLGTQSRYFVQGVLRAQQTLFNTFVAAERVSQIQIGELQVELAAGRELGNWGELRLGFRSGRGDRELVVGDSAIALTDDFDRGEVYARFTVDQLDSAYFPRGGGVVRAEWLASRTGLGADQQFEQLQLRMSGARTWGRHTLYGGVRYNATLSGTAPLQSQFRLGGFFEIGGLDDNQLTGQHSGRALAAFYRRIGDIAVLPAYAGITVEAGNVWSRRSEMSFSNTIIGGSVWIGADTPIGPVYLAYGHAETGDDAFYLFLGPVF
jgi:NTE family protein